jgi:FkbM family methyltransferase
VIAWISRKVFDGVTYTAKHGLIRGMRRRGGLGWTPEWSEPTKEEMFWRELPLEGLVVYDLGAYHGILTLFFASHAEQVMAYEPNQRNYARLMENIALNKLTNVTVKSLAIGSGTRSGTLIYNPSMAGGGSVHPNAEGLISQPVEIATLDGDIAACTLPAPDLIKIDIEGGELEALEGARATLNAHHPALFLEMHGETMREKKQKVRDIVAFLVENGYRNILHVETSAAIGPDNAAIAAEGHLYCRYTP